MAPHDRPVLVAPDSFKGTLTAQQVAAAIGRGLVRGRPAGPGPRSRRRRRRGDDGGAARPARRRGRHRRSPAIRSGARSRPAWRCSATAGPRSSRSPRRAGWPLLAPEERDAEAATSAGTGQLIAAAIAAGAAHVLVAAGGSATTDGGRGAIEAIAGAGGLGRARITVLCDVRTPFEQAASVFGPQKGADAAAVARLERRLAAFGLPRGVPMTGAAGGLAGGLWATFGAELVAGAPFVLDALDFDRRMLREPRGDRRRGPARRDQPARARSPPRSQPARASTACRPTRSSAAARWTASTPGSSICRRFSQAGDEAAIEQAAAALARVI